MVDLNGWKESASMVLAEQRRQATVQKEHEERFRTLQGDLMLSLTDIKVEIAGMRSDVNGRISLVEGKLKGTCAKIGKTEETCREHTQKLSMLSERVDQHAHQQNERFKIFGDIWDEINKLRDWVKKVNDAGLIDQTEGRVRWGWAVGMGGVGGVVVNATIWVIQVLRG